MGPRGRKPPVFLQYCRHQIYIIYEDVRRVRRGKLGPVANCRRP